MGTEGEDSCEVGDTGGGGYIQVDSHLTTCFVSIARLYEEEKQLKMGVRVRRGAERRSSENPKRERALSSKRH
jgi:hypothetical protein